MGIFFLTILKSLYVEKSYIDISGIVSFRVEFSFIRRLIDILFLIRPVI